MTPTRSVPISRRGFTLTEMLMALALIAVVGSIATQIAARVLRLGRDLATGEREELAVDRAVATMRRDVERATSVAAVPDGVSLGPAVTWMRDGDGLLRLAGKGMDDFGPLPRAATITIAGPLVTLHIGDAAWTWRPLVEPDGGKP